MRALIALALTVSACSTAVASSTPKVKVGEAAPEFSLVDLDGTTHSLSQYRDKVVVLEWFNPGCPFVVHAHGEGALTTLAGTYEGKEVVWLAINSGAPGKQGHGVQANKEAAAQWNMQHPILLDESGAVGRAYAAKTTPQMYVIDPAGTLQYAGGLDNAPRGDQPASGYLAFTKNAVDAVIGGKPVSPNKTQSWGCSVKYGS